MSSSKLTSRNSDLKRERLSASTSIDFLGIDRTSSDARCNFVSDTVTVDGRLKIGSADQNPLFNAKNTLLDGDSEPPRTVRKTADDVWREIVAGKKSEQQPKKEMMTLEDFLLKAEAAEEAASGGDGATVEVKEEELSGGIFANKNSGAIGKVIGEGGFGRGRGKRSLSLSEPLDKAAQQREIRMIKNRESAARSRERKQAYEAELESMAERLEEENDGLLKEKAEYTKQRLKQLMENVIPVTETRRPSRVLRKFGSMQW